MGDIEDPRGPWRGLRKEQQRIMHDVNVRPVTNLIIIASVVLWVSQAATANLHAAVYLYYRCVRPQTPICIATTPEAKADCPHTCRQWMAIVFNAEHIRQRVEDQLATVNLNWEVAPANFFLDAAAQQIYGKGLPKTQYGFPVTVSKLYDDPESVGWREVEEDEDKLGAIVIWPSIGGFVTVEESGAGTPDHKLKLLYPSWKKKALWEAEVKELGTAGEPKFVVPKLQ